MKKTLGAFLLVAGLVIAGRTVMAHHAFGAEFDPNAPIRLQGKVVRLEWVNPHTWIHIEVVKDGKPEVWMVEGGTPNTLLRRGITRDTVAVGTEIIVDGYQTKDHSLKRANGRDVTFTDGRKLFMGSSGTGAPRDGSDPTEGGSKPAPKTNQPAERCSNRLISRLYFRAGEEIRTLDFNLGNRTGAPLSLKRNKQP